MYLDCDTNPPIRSVLSQCGLGRSIKLAKEKLANVTEGQIGLYRNHMGHGFAGYVIKYQNQEPYFEAAEIEP